ncbi:arabinose 5-phosphate isomerase [hydrocarbon metagenome]|uniref:Arabinose 5-phosphate isomerase n=1 Tax=hydrocarbon metagenome TaxID=938273 RepID=A0A0W8G6L8_9ZZZZ
MSGAARARNTPGAAGTTDILGTVREALAIEIDALRTMHARLDGRVEEAVRFLLEATGRVIFTGMGKAGHVARKLAATFSSTGTPAIFLHPGEAYHGDLGVIGRSDVAVILSNSGETEEILKLLPPLRRFRVRIIALTGNVHSTLGTNSDVVLDTGVAREACPLNCAPTASTITAMALGDALACALVKAKGFRREDFAMFHPGGSLGSRLLLHVRDVITPLSETPIIRGDMSLRDAVVAITNGRIGAVLIVNAQEELCGIFTDGDLRRLMQSETFDLGTHVAEVMTQQPLTIEKDKLAVEALVLMNERKISVLPVLKAGDIAGAVQIHSLLKHGLA